MKERDKVMRKDGGAATQCLTVHRLEAVLAGVASGPIRMHVAECLHCQTEVALMRQFLQAMPTAEESVDLRQIERRLRQSPPWGQETTGWFGRLFSSRPTMGLATAGLAALLAVGVWFGSPSRVGVEPVDSGLTRTTFAIEGLEPLGDLAQLPSSLRWRALPNASSYQVSLLDVEGTITWSARQSGAELSLPTEALALITNRKTLFWSINAYDAQGSLITTGAPQRFRLVQASH